MLLVCAVGRNNAIKTPPQAIAQLRRAWSAYLDGQHREPRGAVGRIVGRRMLRQHAPETAWSLGLLQLRPADRVLELGFGAGRALALALAQAHQGHITGVDRSPTMLRVAARRNRAAIERGRLALARGDIAALPLAGPRFDKLLSIHTFYFWPDPQAICAELAGLLAPGGRLVSTFATARRLPGGAWQVWEIQRTAEALVAALDQQPGISAALLEGPDSREFNNVAIVMDRIETE